jgi:hypothetical protein
MSTQIDDFTFTIYPLVLPEFPHLLDEMLGPGSAGSMRHWIVVFL